MVEERFTVPDDIAVRVSEADMRFTVERILEAVGLPEADAAQAADTLLYADIRGIDSHGVSNMFPIYMAWFKNGFINRTPSPRVVREAAAVATIDDDEGLGLVTGPRAMDLAIAKAEKCGIGAVSVTNGRHYGAASYHAHRAVDHAMIGVSMTIGGLMVLPTFGAKPILEESLVPEEFFMLPTGGTRQGGSHKGYGLAVMVDILCGLLGGDPPGFVRPGGDVSHHFVAYKIDAFCDGQEFDEHMETFLRGLRETPPAKGHDRVLYAGLAEHETEQERRRNGIPYHPDVVQYFKDVSAQVGVDHRL